MMLLTGDVIRKLGVAFPDGVIRCVTLEFFPLGRNGKCYVPLGLCETEEDINCAMINYLSRDAYKTEPYHSVSRNSRFNREVRDGLNRFLGTNFSRDDLELIYTYMGNGVNEYLTIAFVRSGYNLDKLKEVVK